MLLIEPSIRLPKQGRENSSYSCSGLRPADLRLSSGRSKIRARQSFFVEMEPVNCGLRRVCAAAVILLYRDYSGLRKRLRETRLRATVLVTMFTSHPEDGLKPTCLLAGAPSPRSPLPMGWDDGCKTVRDFLLVSTLFITQSSPSCKHSTPSQIFPGDIIIWASLRICFVSCCVLAAAKRTGPPEGS